MRKAYMPRLAVALYLGMEEVTLRQADYRGAPAVEFFVSASSASFSATGSGPVFGGSPRDRTRSGRYLHQPARPIR
jgi:hypothetical protein